MTNNHTRVILVRHGRSTYNEQQRYQGCCDESVLTEKGKLQALKTGLALSQIRFDAVYVSPLKRTQETDRR
ncbi:MAG: histidine phosphatase family protein, partial [Cyanobacteria bacterium J06573_2]